MTSWYNEIDRTAAAWLRELQRDGHISPGTVEETPLERLAHIPHATRCHFFAGIGGWDLALRLAGWPDDLPVWTGSCPCQPFSTAGKRRGTADARHLWPAWRRLIAERRPPVIFGEQVASGDGRQWLAGVRADLEALGYAVGAADLCAAGVGAPHIRQRLYFVAERLDISERHGLQGRKPVHRQHDWEVTPNGFVDGGVADRESGGCGVSRDEALKGGGRHSDGGVPNDGVADAELRRREQRDEGQRGVSEPDKNGQASGGSTPPPGPWDASIWHRCSDGSYRRIPAEPALFPLAHGVSGRVGLLRGAGNAIVPQLAAAFTRTYRGIAAAMADQWL